MDKTLVIMAAGMGSRYGGNKQIDGMGPHNEVLMLYSIYDAVKRLLDGDSSLWGTTWVADMSNGYVGIGYGEDGAAQQVPDDVKNAVEELSKKIVSGEITVETTR